MTKKNEGIEALPKRLRDRVEHHIRVARVGSLVTMILTALITVGMFLLFRKRLSLPIALMLGGFCGAPLLLATVIYLRHWNKDKSPIVRAILHGHQLKRAYPEMMRAEALGVGFGPRSYLIVFERKGLLPDLKLLVLEKDYNKVMNQLRPYLGDKLSTTL
ncbi:MAG: hypothetical protein EP343_09315 [Deltaproteobacteria bacterium]|nr:MAG: hypothetical protein EP343_09315 [Deltaproteobacteria bacterium]